MIRNVASRRVNPAVRGSAILELALVFIPMMFGIFGVLDVGRAMWSYHTVAFAVKKGTRFAIVHGARCTQASTDCQATVADVAGAIQQVGIGLDPGSLQLTLTAGDQTVTCATLSACLSNASAWPPDPDNAVGLPITIKGSYTFRPVTPMWWPGQSSNVYTLGAKSTEIIQF